MEDGCLSATPGGDRGKLPSLPMKVERSLAPLHMETPDRNPLQEGLRLHLREVAELRRHEAGGGEESSPLKCLLGGAVAPDYAILDSGLENEPLYLVRCVEAASGGVDGVEEGHGGLEGVEEVMGEGKVAAIASLIDGNYDFGHELLDKVKYCGEGWIEASSDGEIHGNGLICGCGFREDFSRVEGFDA